MIKVVLFDLDNTLYEYAPCDLAGKELVQKFLARELKVSQKKIAKLYTAARHQVHDMLPHQAASHSRLLYCKALIENHAGRSNSTQALKAEQLFWKGYFTKMKLRPGVRQLLRLIRAQGYKMGIVSDLTTSIQMRKINRLRISEYIDFVITSEEVGVEKPDPAMITYVLRKLSLPAHCAVLIGDSLERDKLAAQRSKVQFMRLANDDDVINITKKIIQP